MKIYIIYVIIKDIKDGLLRYISGLGLFSEITVQCLPPSTQQKNILKQFLKSTTHTPSELF